MPEAILKGRELLAEAQTYLSPTPVDPFSVRVLRQKIEKQVNTEPADLSAHTAGMVLGACSHDTQEIARCYDRAVNFIGYHPDITHNYMLALVTIFRFDECFELAQREIEAGRCRTPALAQAYQTALWNGRYQLAEQIASAVQGATEQDREVIQRVREIASLARDLQVTDHDARQVVEPMVSAVWDVAGLTGRSVQFWTRTGYDPDWGGETITHTAVLKSGTNLDTIEAVYDRYNYLRAQVDRDTAADHFVSVCLDVLKTPSAEKKAWMTANDTQLPD